MAPSYQQDMPPKQGYGSVEWAQVFAKKKRGRGFLQFGAFLGISLGALTIHEYLYSFKRQNMLEDREFRIVMEPFLYAERGRAIIKQLRSNRDEERELMKDVPNWKVGHLYDTPVYHKKQWHPIPLEEIFVHAPYKEYHRANFERLNHA